METAGSPVIQLSQITKRFNGVAANDNISLEIQPGEIHALVGENGAGKSTLMKILAGLYQPDAGQIFLRGQPVKMDNPRKAIQLGIGMVHQHFMLVQRFTVTENIILGAETGRGGLLDLKEATRQVQELCRRYDFALDPSVPVSQLSVGQQQRVEILKVLFRGADILVMDEPTAVLAPQEVGELFVNLRHLREQGKTIIFIAHKLEEVLSIADRITVLRRGQVVGTVKASETDKYRLAEMMVGRPVLLTREKAAFSPGEELLRLEDVAVAGSVTRHTVRGISLRVRTGEIYGLAGVEGNGQTELVEAIIGLRPVSSGRILLGERESTSLDVRARRNLGVAYVPEDRHHLGLVLPMKIWENLILGKHRHNRILKGMLHDASSIRRLATQMVEEFDIRLNSVERAVASLSGGNQQKVILAREFSDQPCVILAAQPTRGLDIGATEFVETRLLEARAAGKAVLLVSADLDQVISLSDRIGVMFNGELVGEFNAGEVSMQELGQYMMGAKRQEGRASLCEAG